MGESKAAREPKFNKMQDLGMAVFDLNCPCKATIVLLIALRFG